MRTTNFTNIHTMEARDLPAVLHTTKAPEVHTMEARDPPAVLHTTKAPEVHHKFKRVQSGLGRPYTMRLMAQGTISARLASASQLP